MKCEVCGKNHHRYKNTKIKLEGKWITMLTIVNPCLKKLAKEAVGLTNSIIEKTGEKHATHRTTQKQFGKSCPG